MNPGVLAYQGAVEEHLKALWELGHNPLEVRTVADLEQVDSLILPGGESTTIGKLLARFGLLEAIRQRPSMPIWGTCAGMILLARELENGLSDQPLLGLMDITVRRNAYGRQLESFETDLEVAGQSVRGVFIRAPLVTRCGRAVEVLGYNEGQIVAVRQGHYLATSFHPELTADRRMHEYFLSLAAVPAG